MTTGVRMIYATFPSVNARPDLIFLQPSDLPQLSNPLSYGLFKAVAVKAAGEFEVYHQPLTAGVYMARETVKHDGVKHFSHEYDLGSWREQEFIEAVVYYGLADFYWGRLDKEITGGKYGVYNEMLIDLYNGKAPYRRAVSNTLGWGPEFYNWLNAWDLE